MYKRFLMIFVLFILFGVTTVTATDGNTGTPDTSWYDNDPSAKIFYISTADQLAGLSRIVNFFYGTYVGEQFEGKIIRLTKDIDVSVYERWVPIGWIDTVANIYAPFQGTFDGNNRVIRGLATDEGYDFGLFGIASNATIKNLGLEDVVIYSHRYVGGIVARAWNTNIENCYVTGSIEGVQGYYGWGVGGIAGEFTGGSITNSSFNGTIKQLHAYVGGIVGEASLATIENCYSAGEISVDVGGVGGLAGTLSGSIKNSYSTMSIFSEDLEIGTAGGISAEFGGDIINCVALNPVLEGGFPVARVVGWGNGLPPTNLYNTYALDTMVLNSEHWFGIVIEDGEDITMPQALTAEFWTDTLGWDTYIWNIQDGKLPTLHHFPPFPPTGVGDMRPSMLLLLALSAISALLWTAIFLPHPHHSHHSPTQDG
ncbi:MAG: hypothetical protein FWG87_05925 [Defluviitaleaceae bacterium]|nr:hypothetical protein [Defluviitaleaceae bacterium]